MVPSVSNGENHSVFVSTKAREQTMKEAISNERSKMLQEMLHLHMLKFASFHTYICGKAYSPRLR